MKKNTRNKSEHFHLLQLMPVRTYYDKDYGKTFVNVECPYCSSILSYLYWLKYTTVGYCPDCNTTWTECDNGDDVIWQLQ